MNMMRLIAIALPVAFLLACGGGGGGTAAAPNMPGTGGSPNTPGTGSMAMPETLPGYAVDAAMARTHIGVMTAPTAANTMTEMAIVTEIQTRATTPNRFEFTDFSGTPSVDIECTNNNSSCSGTVPDVGRLTFSLTGIDDLSLVDETGLVGFNSNTQAVMLHRGVTLIQSQAVARDSNGTQLTFLTYGGWATNSVFGVERLDVLEDGETTTRYASFSFGNATGSNPQFTAEQQQSLGSNLRWNGVMVGTDTETGHILQGDVLMDYVNSDLTVLDLIRFNNVKNLTTGADVTFGSGQRSGELAFTAITLTNGNFEKTTGGDSIKGSFYGTGHEAAAGIFNSGTHNIIGAFGAEKP